MQTYLYYRWYPNDHVILKLLVAAILFLEIADTAVSIIITWAYLVSSWGNDEGLFMAPWSFCVAVMLTGIIAALSQSFFARRVWLLSHSKSMVVMIIILALVQCGSAIAGSAQVLSINLQNSAKLSTFNLFAIWLGCSAGCDLLIAGTMVYYLSMKRSQLLTKSQDYIVTRLINFSMQTGVFTAVCAVTTLILSLTSTTTYLKDASFLPLGKLYANALLANLNARTSVFSGMDMAPVNEEHDVFTDRPHSMWTGTVGSEPLPSSTDVGKALPCDMEVSLQSQPTFPP